jgi:cytochrome c oxidase cbb3-type subunit I/II
MPPYPWLYTQRLDTNSLPARIAALRRVGVPYAPGFENGDAQKDLATQAARIVVSLRVGSITNAPADAEIIGLIAYLQRLGTDIKSAPAAAQSTEGSVPVAALTSNPNP